MIAKASCRVFQMAAWRIAATKTSPVSHAEYEANEDKVNLLGGSFGLYV